ncbi:hypothetical protein ACR6C2_24950 [Streptomyces sp. INA 01156]
MQQSWNSDRRRTAIGRSSLSVPARQALADRQLNADRTILDYGCGRGGDVASLQRLDCKITGWDPTTARARRWPPPTSSSSPTS